MNLSHPGWKAYAARMRRWGVLAGVVVGRLAFGLQFQAVASAGPELSVRFGLDYAALGALVGAYMAAGVVLSLPAGLLARVMGERAVVGAGLALMAAGAAVAALAGSAGGLGWGRLLAGAGGVTLLVMQGKMVADRFTGPGFLPAMGLALGAFPVGVGLSGLLADRLGWDGLAWVGVLPALLASALIATFAHQPRIAGNPRLGLPSWRECGLVLLAGLVWTFYNGGYYAVLAYLPSLLAERGQTPGVSAAVMAVATWSNLPAMVLAGWAAARIGPARVFAVGTAAAVAGMCGIALLPWPVAWSVLLGTLGGMHAGVIVGMATLSARPENQAVGMGIFYTIYFAGVAGLPALYGRVADAMGDPAYALLTGAGMVALCAPFFAWHRAASAVAPARVPA